MNARQERVLELAREAWRADEPSEARVEVAARRIERQLRSRRRSRPARRHTLVLAFIVVFGGAAAWAASGGAPRVFGFGPAPALPALLSTAARPGLGAGVAVLTARARVTSQITEPEAHALDPAAEPTLAAPGEPRNKTPRVAVVAEVAPAAPAASWREVARALDAKDDDRTRRALEGLAKSTDATTRAKARLGLAQLARSRGDCATAKRIAAEVAAMQGVESSVTQRAAALAAACD
jgi:hypothetical protein